MSLHSFLPRHIVHQTPVLRTLAGAFFQLMCRSAGKGSFPDTLPGDWIHAVVPPRPDALIDDYITHVGGSLSVWRENVPPHFFPQFSLPLMAETLKGLPWDMARIINGGCSIRIADFLPRRTRIHMKARLQSIQQTGRLVVITQQLIIGTRQKNDMLHIEQTSLIPQKSEGPTPSTKKERMEVPLNVREIGRFHVGARAGLDFAFLTGDFNPLHWIGPLARLSGFKGPILHGFATLARSMEMVTNNVLDGDRNRLKAVCVRFTTPLVLPGDAAVFIDDAGRIFTGKGLNEAAYLTGSLEII